MPERPRLALIDAAAAGRIVEHLQQNGIDPRLLQATAADLLPALERGKPGAAELTSEVARALRERDQRGDLVLAEQLERRVAGRESERPRLPVDLLDLADLLESSQSDWDSGFIDLTNGDVLPRFFFEDGYVDDPIDLEEEPDRWLRVDREVFSREAWEDMADFADSVQDPMLRVRLQDALEGRGAFSRFRRVINENEKYDDLWMAFLQERQMGRAVRWLADAGYDVGVRRYP